MAYEEDSEGIRAGEDAGGGDPEASEFIPTDAEPVPANLALNDDGYVVVTGEFVTLAAFAVQPAAAANNFAVHLWKMELPQLRQLTQNVDYTLDPPNPPLPPGNRPRRAFELRLLPAGGNLMPGDQVLLIVSNPRNSAQVACVIGVLYPRHGNSSLPPQPLPHRHRLARAGAAH